MRHFVLTVAQPGFDAGDALAGFDGRGAGHSAQDGVTAWRLAYTPAGHGGDSVQVTMQAILPGTLVNRKRKMGVLVDRI
jgi:hypothetical protein